MRDRSALLLSALLLCAVAPSPVWAWGATGHRIIGRVALQTLPAGLPAFLHTQDAVWQVGETAREPDRWRGAGGEHDAERNAGHFVDLTEDGKVQGVMPLSELPATREAYDTVLRAGNSNQYKAGYLPYSIIIGFQQLRYDFGYWRADVAGIKFAKTKAARAWFTADRKLHERLTLRDLAVWAHFVGDASMPLHVSVHHDGWGKYPNPDDYVSGAGIHAKFEGTFVRANFADKDVAALMPAFHACACQIQDETKAYLARDLEKVIPLYQLEKEGGFEAHDPRGKEFVGDRLAVGAAELRVLIAEAWTQSATVSLGYPAIAMHDIEAGQADLLGSLQGLD